MKVQATWKWFAEFTTIGGIGQVVVSKEKAWKLFWSIITTTFMTLTIYQVIKVVKEYLEYDVTTKLSVEPEDVMQMPSVTICNNNRIHCGNLLQRILSIENDDGAKKRSLCKLLILTGCDITVQLAEIQQTGNVTSNVDICEAFIDEMPIVRKIQEELNINAIQSALFESYLELDIDDAKAISHKPEDLIKECLLGKTTSDECLKLLTQDATTIAIPDYGLCYIYNLNPLDENSTESINAPGPQHGLTLTFNLETYYNMRYGLTKSSGVMIALHDPNKMPTIKSKPIYLEPRKKTWIRIQKAAMKRQKSPYISDCSDDYPSAMENQFQNFTSKDYLYSSSYCKTFCMNTYIHEICNCTDPLHLEGIFLDDLGGIDLDFCSTIKESSQRLCANQAANDFDTSQGDLCSCRSECHSVDYQMSISQSEWPSDQYWAVLAEEHQVKFKDFMVTYKDVTSLELLDTLDFTATNVKDIVKSNFISVTIYFGTFDVTTIQEVPQYNFWGFLSTLGGAFSLFLGLTFIQLLEVVELIFKLLFNSFH